MSENNSNKSRRQFMKTTGTAATVGALAATAIPSVHAAENNTINIALVGCGGRGSGAAANALATKYGPTKLVAMADVFPGKLKNSHKSLTNRFGAKKVAVPAERQFIGFDAYKKAIDTLGKNDVVIFTTPCAFRWVHYGYAIEKGVNVFMEKPITVDGASTRKMLELNKKAKKKNMKVGVGLMCRHCHARGEAVERIRDGQLGDILLMRAYRMAGPTGNANTKANKGKKYSELMYQIRNFHGFLWLSGGAFSDFLIHNIDECCWMKGDWPISAKGSGGRHYRGDYVDQNFDSYSVEYTFKDGTKMQLSGRTIAGCHNEFASYAHGTKGSLIFSSRGHVPAKSRIYKGQNMGSGFKSDLVWAAKQPEPNPYQVEWDDILDAIRNDRPYNEVDRGAKASLVTSMGRMASHTGRIITYNEMLNSKHEFAPNVDKLTLESESPLKSIGEGRYPIPMPGLNNDTEY